MLIELVLKIIRIIKIIADSENHCLLRVSINPPVLAATKAPSDEGAVAAGD